MRKVNYIVIHCSATPKNTRVQSILNYWKNNLGWKSVGYHCLIEDNGKINKLADFQTVTNGVAGYNTNSIHISYIGGVDGNNKPFDNRSDAQKGSILECIKEARKLYPNAQILGHKDFANVAKACPSFDAKKEYQNV